MGRRDEQDRPALCLPNCLFFKQLPFSLIWSSDIVFLLPEWKGREDKSNKTICHLFHFYGNELNQASHDELEIVIGFWNYRRDLTFVFSVCFRFCNKNFRLYLSWIGLQLADWFISFYTFYCEQVSIAGQPGGVEAARVKIRVSWTTTIFFLKGCSVKRFCVL